MEDTELTGEQIVEKYSPKNHSKPKTARSNILFIIPMLLVFTYALTSMAKEPSMHKKCMDVHDNRGACWKSEDSTSKECEQMRVSLGWFHNKYGAPADLMCEDAKPFMNGR